MCWSGWTIKIAYALLQVKVLDLIMIALICTEFFTYYYYTLSLLSIACDQSRGRMKTFHYSRKEIR